MRAERSSDSSEEFAREISNFLIFNFVTYKMCFVADLYVVEGGLGFLDIGL